MNEIESASSMTTAQLVTSCIELDKLQAQNKKLMTQFQAELQTRGLFEMSEHNVKYVKYYSEQGSASIADRLTLDILAPDKLKGLVGAGVWATKVKETTETKYKCDSKFERMLKAVFTGDYTFESTLEEFLLDEMKVTDSVKRQLLIKKLKGEFERDRETLTAVLYSDADTVPDLDVELWYIYRIKNAELIRAFLPEEFIDETIQEIRKSIIVESKLAIAIDYDSES